MTNYWRLAWVAITNGALATLLLTGPVRVHHNQQTLSEAMRMPDPTFSYWQQLFTTPWVPVLALVLLVGIAAEALRSALSPIFNVSPYLCWLIVAVWERAKVAAEATPQDLFLGKVLLIFPLAFIAVVDLSFYMVSFRKKTTKRGADLPP